MAEHKRLLFTAAATFSSASYWGVMANEGEIMEQGTSRWDREEQEGIYGSLIALVLLEGGKSGVCQGDKM